MKIRSMVIPVNPPMEVELGCGPKGLVRADQNSDLEVNLILIEDSLRSKVLLVSIDSLYAGPDFVSTVRSTFREKFDPGEVFIVSSHTHNAPMIDSTKPLLGETSATYLTFIKDRVVMGINELLEIEPIDCKMKSINYGVSTSTYRRKATPYQVTRKGLKVLPTLLLPNPKTKIKPEATVIQFSDLNDQPVATIWVMPCHPVSFPRELAVSANYIGDIRREVRARFGPNDEYPFIFLQGASGDLRPPASKNPNFGFFGRLANPGMTEIFCSFSEGQYQSWVNLLLRELTSALDLMESKASFEPSHVATRIERKALGSFFNGNVEKRFFEVHILRLGDSNLVGISAEPTWKSVNWLLGRREGIIVGCLGDTFGYLPSFVQWISGGYEKSGFMPFFGIRNKFLRIPGQLRLLVFSKRQISKLLQELDRLKSR